MEQPKPKCYVAGKISGLTAAYYVPRFLEAAEEVKRMGMEPVLPIDGKYGHSDEVDWLTHMKNDITVMLSCDVVYMLSNWKTSTGAGIEYSLAKRLGMPVLLEEVLNHACMYHSMQEPFFTYLAQYGIDGKVFDAMGIDLQADSDYRRTQIDDTKTGHFFPPLNRDQPEAL